MSARRDPAPTGFVGAGAMGSALVLRAAECGHRLVVHDRDPERLAAVAAADGIEAVQALGDLAGCELVVCVLPDSEVVDAVVAGPGGLLEVLAPGALIVDMGSSDPRRTVALAEAAGRVGIGVVDAPVSGGVRRAREGELSIMFGGDAGQLACCRSLFASLSHRVFPMGEVGSGHAMKALNNLVSASGLAIACEAIEIGRRHGLDPGAMLEVLNHSTGSNNATQTKVGQFVLSGTYGSGFALRLMLKDVALAVELGASEGVPAGMGEACRALWRRAADSLPGTADQTEIARVWSEPADPAHDGASRKDIRA